MTHWKSGTPVLAKNPAPLNHPALGPVQYSVQQVSDNPDRQVAQTIAMMRRYAIEDAKSAEIHEDVYRAWQEGEPIGDTWGYIKGRLQFVRDEITAEPLQPYYNAPIVETLVRPKDMAVLPVPQGDCDCYSMYGAAHLLARGVPCSYVTVAADGNDPTAFSHVYLVAYPVNGPYTGQRVPMDLSHGPHPGWEVANRYGKRKEWPIDHSNVWIAAGLSLAASLALAKMTRSPIWPAFAGVGVYLACEACSGGLN